MCSVRRKDAKWRNVHSFVLSQSVINGRNTMLARRPILCSFRSEETRRYFRGIGSGQNSITFPWKFVNSRKSSFIFIATFRKERVKLIFTERVNLVSMLVRYLRRYRKNPVLLRLKKKKKNNIRRKTIISHVASVSRTSTRVGRNHPCDRSLRTSCMI